MSLTLQQLKALDDLVQTGLDRDPSDRRAWFDSLAIDDARLRELLERALFPNVKEETHAFLDRPPVIEVAAADAHQFALAPGQLIGPYCLVALLGEGGTASVWRATRSDGVLKRDVALKLPYFIGNSHGWYERVARERDILASLNHANIATIYDAGVEPNGRPWLALELVDGKAVDQFCRDHALPVDDRIGLFVRIARAVEHAHARGIIHRDLKPANILIDDNGQPKLLDFGIAKLLDTADASVSGVDETLLTRLHGRPLTPGYASPEQKRGETITTGADVYALGVVLYELLVGARPNADPSAAGERDANPRIDLRAAAKANSDRAAVGTLRDDLNAIIQKALHGDLSKRYGTVNAFADDLERYLRREIVVAQPDSGWYRAAQFVRRNKVIVGASAAVAASLVIGSGVAIWQAREAQTQQVVAQNEAQRANATRKFLLALFDPGLDDATTAKIKRKQSVEQLLAEAAKKIETEFADQPRAKVEMLKAIGSLHFELQLHASAYSLAKQRLDLLTENGASAAELASARLDLAQVLTSQGKEDQAISTLGSALAALNGLPGREAERLRATAQLYRANVSVQKGDMSGVVAEAANAAAALEAAAPNEREHIQAIALHAYGLLASGKVQDSIRIFGEALDRHSKGSAPSAYVEAALRTQYSEALSVAQRIDEAISEAKKSVAIANRSAGETSYIGGRTAYWAGKLLVGAGQIAEGLALLRSANKTFSRLEDDADPQQLVVTRAFLVEGLLASGQLAEANQAADELRKILARYAADNRLIAARSIADGWLAQLERANGRFEDAARIRKEWITQLSKSYPARSELLLNGQAALAATYFDAGNPRRALEHLRTHEPPLTTPDGKLTRSGLQMSTVRVRAHAALNDPGALDAARKLLSRIEEEIKPEQRALRVFEFANIHRTLAEAALASAQHREAEKHMRETILLTESRLASSSPQLASDRSLLALALLGVDKQSKEAQKLAELAKSALFVEKNAGPQFRKHLSEFQRRTSRT
jgi:eukaryotic-like serine/threonine-protein kinase